MTQSMFHGSACNGKGKQRGQPAVRLLLGLTLLPAMVLANVGHNSCVGENACLDNTGDVKNDSCNGLIVCQRNTGDVGNDSCNGFIATCERNTGDVKNDSCNGYAACTQNTGDVGNGSCTGFVACLSNLDGVRERFM